MGAAILTAAKHYGKSLPGREFPSRDRLPDENRRKQRWSKCTAINMILLPQVYHVWVRCHQDILCKLTSAISQKTNYEGNIQTDGRAERNSGEWRHRHYGPNGNWRHDGPASQRCPKRRRYAYLRKSILFSTNTRIVSNIFMVTNNILITTTISGNVYW